MLPLYRSSVLMVEQPRQLFSAEGYYQVFDEQGFPVAHVREDTSVWNFSRGTKRCPHRFHVLAPTGEPLLTLDKPWQRGLPHVYVYTADGRPMGAIVQDLKLLGSRFVLEDHNGVPIGRLEGSWTNWNFRIFDGYENEIARISKQHTGLRRGGWRTEDRYAVELGPQIHEPLRTLIVSGAITVDVLLHERDEDFYTGGPGAARAGVVPPSAHRHAAAAERRAERQADAAERRAEVAERRAELHERKAEIAERKAEVAQRSAERKVRKAEVAETKAKVAAKKTQSSAKTPSSAKATGTAKTPSGGTGKTQGKPAGLSASAKGAKGGASGGSSARSSRDKGSPKGGSGGKGSAGSSDRGRDSGKRR